MAIYIKRIIQKTMNNVMAMTDNPDEVKQFVEKHILS